MFHFSGHHDINQTHFFIVVLAPKWHLAPFFNLRVPAWTSKGTTFFHQGACNELVCLHCKQGNGIVGDIAVILVLYANSSCTRHIYIYIYIRTRMWSSPCLQMANHLSVLGRKQAQWWLKSWICCLTSFAGINEPHDHNMFIGWHHPKWTKFPTARGALIYALMIICW